jgi:glycosyltransferase involved in cell wall biosynthesis
LPNSPGEAEQVNKLAKANIRYHVVRNGVNEDIFQISSDLQERDIPLLYVGLVDRTKNIHRLVQAITAVNVPLTVIGQEPDAPYSQYCRALDKQGLVTWLGKTTHEKLVDYYNRSHVVVLNSFRETPGLTLLEGAACGANVIATKIGSAKEYFEGFAHYCDPFSIEEISNAIRMSLSQPSPNLELSRMVRSNYTWHLAAQDTLEGYQKVLS